MIGDYKEFLGLLGHQDIAILDGNRNGLAIRVDRVPGGIIGTWTRRAAVWPS